MRRKLLFVLVFLSSVQVMANHRNFYDYEYKYRNANADFKNSAYENTKNNSVKFYNSGMFGWGIKFLEGDVEAGGNKGSVEHSVMSPLMGVGLGVAIDRDTFLKQIRIAGEFKYLPNLATAIVKQNSVVVASEKDKDTSVNLMLNSYFDFNDITEGKSLYFSLGMGEWFREDSTSTEKSFAFQLGFGFSSQLTEMISVDTGVYVLSPVSKFKKTFNGVDVSVEAGELGMGVSVRSLF